MHFLWKSQLKQERGRFLPKSSSAGKKTNRKERLEVKAGRTVGVWLLLIVLWVLFLGTVGYLVLFSPYLALDPPRITGLHAIDEPAFREVVMTSLGQRYFGQLSRNRFFLVQPEKLAEELRERYPLIRNISIERTFPNTLTLGVEERETIVLWCSDMTCLHVRENGAAFPVTDVYQEQSNVSRTLTITDDSGQSVEPGEQAFEPEFSLFPVELKQALLDKLGIGIERNLTVSSRFANELRVKTNPGWQLFVSTRLPVDSSLSALALLLDSEIPKERQSDLLYIDLRTENRIFYRYQDGREEQMNTQEEANASPESTKKETSKTEKAKKK